MATGQPESDRERAQRRYALTIRAAKRALRRGGPERVALIVVPAATADRLRAGVAAERVLLRDGGAEDELPELVLLPPDSPPERLAGWSPPRWRGHG